MNRRLALAVLALFAFAPAVEAGGHPIPMQEIIDSPFPWRMGQEATLDQAQKAVYAGLTAKGWTATQAAPGKVRGVIQKPDWRCEIEVEFNARSYSIRYSASEHLDYDADRRMIHRNFNRWLQLLRQQIDIAAQNSTG